MTEKLPEPLCCVACGRLAHYIVNGTSLCRDHHRNPPLSRKD